MAIDKDTIVKGVIIVVLFLIVFLGSGKGILNAAEKDFGILKGQAQDIGSNAPDVQTQLFTEQAKAPNKPTDDLKDIINTKYYGEVPSAPRRYDQKPSKIVLHHTGGSSASGAIAALKASGLSAHYVLDINGVIYFLVSEDRAAFHCGCCWPSKRDCCGQETCFVCIEDNPVADNHNSIGIEIVNSGNEADDYTPAQYASLKRLLTDISRSDRQGIAINNDNVVAHYQISPVKWDPSPNFDWKQIGLEKPRPPEGLTIPIPASAGYS